MLMTFILISSSLTMLIGLRYARAGDKSAAFRWILITAAAGTVFALLHIREWMGPHKKSCPPNQSNYDQYTSFIGEARTRYQINLSPSPTQTDPASKGLLPASLPYIQCFGR